jgi:hypothetical protein
MKEKINEPNRYRFLFDNVANVTKAGTIFGSMWDLKTKKIYVSNDVPVEMLLSKKLEKIVGFFFREGNFIDEIKD